jgi:hypothetical protein
MIHIIREYDDACETHSIIAVVETDLDLENLYKDFIYAKAKEMDIVINSFWFNIMDYNMHKTYLTVSQYNKKKSKWANILKKNTLLSFAKSELGLNTKEFITLNNSRG